MAKIYAKHDPYAAECPYCGGVAYADFIDIGVGMQQCGPYGCEKCGASQISPFGDTGPISEEEKRVGWYRGSKANG